MKRIDVEQLRDVADTLFGEKRFNGPKVAEAIREKRVTLWSWLHRRGMPPEKAEALAEAVENRSMELIRIGSRLRQLAVDARAAED